MFKHPVVEPLATPADLMSDAERLNEVAQILAAGILRGRERTARQRSIPSTEIVTSAKHSSSDSGKNNYMAHSAKTKLTDESINKENPYRRPARKKRNFYDPIIHKK